MDGRLPGHESLPRRRHERPPGIGEDGAIANDADADLVGAALEAKDGRHDDRARKAMFLLWENNDDPCLTFTEPHLDFKPR